MDIYSFNEDATMGPPSNLPNAAIEVLPPEILAHIFSLTLSSRRLAYKNGTEVILSHVCRLWRGVALSMSSLWTVIEVYSRQSHTRLSEYIVRSREKLVDITIDLYNYDKLRSDLHQGSGRIPPFLTQIPNELKLNLHRIRTLTLISFSKHCLLQLLLPFYQSTAPHMQRLVAKYDRDYVTARQLIHRISIFEGGSPRLKHLDTDISTLRPKVCFLQNVVSLSLHYTSRTETITFPEFIRIIETPQCLVYLSLQGCIDQTWPAQLDATQHELPHLEALRILDSDYKTTRFLLSISTPMLQSLWLDATMKHLSQWHPAAHVGPQGTGSRQLKYLTLSPPFITFSEGLSSIFPAVKYLHCLNVSSSQSISLMKLLKSHWASVDTLVLTMVRDSSTKSLVESLRTTLPHRHSSGIPIVKILIDADRCHIFDKEIRSLRSTTTVEPLSSSNYAEPWWNGIDQVRIDDL